MYLEGNRNIELWSYGVMELWSYGVKRISEFGLLISEFFSDW